MTEQSSNTQQDELAIRTLVKEWFDATKSGDTSAVLELMSDDVIFMVPGQEPFGKETFKISSENMKNVKIEGNSEVREIRIIGDWAYLRNYIKMTITPAGKEVIHRSGYTLTILHKESDNRWRLKRDANLVTIDN